MRLDRRLVDEGLAPSRSRARALIEAGVVTVGGRIVRKPADTVIGQLTVTGDPNPWVSRAGLKLDHALETFELTPSGIALDVGASTGGFTEVLLARGAEQVYAVDVGHGQLSPKLAEDPRVTSIEGTNARNLTPGAVPTPDWITVDLSFISLEKVLPAVLALANAGAVLVALVKPQFEAGPAHVGKGGIVRNSAVQGVVLSRVRTLLRDLGWAIIGETQSPIEGGDGNREFLIAARAPGVR